MSAPIEGMPLVDIDTHFTEPPDLWTFLRDGIQRRHRRAPSRSEGPTPTPGADPSNVMVETDFPHPTCLYPGPRKKLEEALAALPVEAQRKVFYENAARDLAGLFR